MGDESRVVTVIEVLSPANKAAGSEGRQLYLAKQRDLLAGETSLIEIDLLRRGEHTVAPPRQDLIPYGPWDYLVSLHRGGESLRYEAWLNGVRDRLPCISVPLSPGDDDVPLPLQPVFVRCYDTGRYGDEIDYRQEPVPPLGDADAEWANALLRERGLRG